MKVPVQREESHLKKAMDLAQTLETVSKDAQMKATEQVPSGSSNVHKVTRL